MTARRRDVELANWPVAVLAGGLATRLRPTTNNIPKALLSVAGEPFLVHQLRLLHSEGFRKIVLCVGYLGEMIKANIGDGKRLGLQIKYSFDGPTLLRTGGALKHVRSERETGFDDSVRERRPLGCKQCLVRSGGNSSI